MNKITTEEYNQKKAYLDALLKQKLITFTEWYKTLLDLREEYHLYVAR